jgi:hypothetical protein
MNRCCIGVAVLALALGARMGDAQMIGLPVLQNAFANPGFTFAGNFGTVEDAHAYGVAAAWAPRVPRFVVSGGLAALEPDEGDRTGTWGARVMAPVVGMRRGSFGLAAFAGLGGTSSSGITELRVPVGATVGYRRALGASRSVSVYVSSFYTWARRSGDDIEAASAGVVRVSAGVDVGLFSSLGLTIGYETGGEADVGDPGPAGGAFGVGVSYSLWRRR